MITALATLALLMPSIASARNSNPRPSDKRKPRTELRVVAHRPNPVSHRPGLGARLIHRPVHGRLVTLKGERLWLANGVLYRMIPSRGDMVYVVVGYR